MAKDTQREVKTLAKNKNNKKPGGTNYAGGNGNVQTSQKGNGANPNPATPPAK